MFEYEESIEEFAAALQDFIQQYELPDKWFKVADHLAIKCADGLDYVFRMEELVPDSQQTSEIVMDQRRLATLHLTSPVSVGSLGEVSWLEVMEPRPEKAGQDVIGLEHIEFYYPDFAEAEQVLNSRGVAFTRQANPGHQWLNIVINDQGQELKLNNKLLSDTVAQELEEGSAHLL